MEGVRPSSRTLRRSIPRSIEAAPMTVLDHTLLKRFVDIAF